MAPRLQTIAFAASWASPLPLPSWLTAKTQRNSKVRLQGAVDAIYLEHNRLVVQVGEEDLIWVFLDADTRFVDVVPEALKPGHKVQVDGLLADDRLQATQVKLLGQLL
ncbi:MAG: hypothetical protein J0I12_27810 [Candidatus Eremiobacteraeota bacterium]|nr:hypothetical protein [Candidatus Eremiobacteraeota bacterium]